MSGSATKYPREMKLDAAVWRIEEHLDYRGIRDRLKEKYPDESTPNLKTITDTWAHGGAKAKATTNSPSWSDIAEAILKHRAERERAAIVDGLPEPLATMVEKHYDLADRCFNTMTGRVDGLQIDTDSVPNAGVLYDKMIERILEATGLGSFGELTSVKPRMLMAFVRLLVKDVGAALVELNLLDRKELAKRVEDLDKRLMGKVAGFVREAECEAASE